MGFTQKSFVFSALLLLSASSMAFGSDTKSAEQAGAVLYRDKGCSFCHGPALTGTKKAPSLEEIRKQKEWSDERITAQILDGGTKMPPFRESLSDDEIAQLIAFLRAKNRPAVPPAERQPAPQH